MGFAWNILASAAEPLILSFKPCYSQEPWLGTYKIQDTSLFGIIE